LAPTDTPAEAPTDTPTTAFPPTETPSSISEEATTVVQG
jgi:hypothetical protein